MQPEKNNEKAIFNYLQIAKTVKCKNCEYFGSILLWVHRITNVKTNHCNLIVAVITAMKYTTRITPCNHRTDVYIYLCAVTTALMHMFLHKHATRVQSLEPQASVCRFANPPHAPAIPRCRCFDGATRISNPGSLSGLGQCGAKPKTRRSFRAKSYASTSTSWSSATQPSKHPPM